MPAPAKPVPVPLDGESIALGNFVKLAGAATGGEAKMLVQSGLVRVNGAVDTRRGHKLKAGDRVDVDGRGAFVVATA